MLYRHYALSVDVVYPLLQAVGSPVARGGVPAQGPISCTPSPMSLDKVPVLSSGNPPHQASWDFPRSLPPQGTGSLFSQEGVPCVGPTICLNFVVNLLSHVGLQVCILDNRDCYLEIYAQQIEVTILGVKKSGIVREKISSTVKYTYDNT